MKTPKWCYRNVMAWFILHFKKKKDYSVECFRSWHEGQLEDHYALHGLGGWLQVGDRNKGEKCTYSMRLGQSWPVLLEEKCKK